jgi:hypothetical protein
MYLPVQAEEMHTTATPTETIDPADPLATQDDPAVVEVTDPAVTDPAVTDIAVTDPAVTDPAVTDPAVESAVEPAAGLTVAPMTVDVPA